MHKFMRLIQELKLKDLLGTRAEIITALVYYYNVKWLARKSAEPFGKSVCRLTKAFTRYLNRKSVCFILKKELLNISETAPTFHNRFSGLSC